MDDGFLEPERFTFFWDGPFSQWEYAEFTVDGVEYNCAEQFMMAEKARLFGDSDTLRWIMESDDPRTQKKLGRVVDGFERRVWEAEDDDGIPHCCAIVWRGNHAKFTQNEHLLELLLDTAGTTLVEASPEDSLWGIGLSEDDPRAHDRTTWAGLNWLGETLTDLRESLLRELRRG
jgi:ribA/ribD-fused uncharacterized protein